MRRKTRGTGRSATLSVEETQAALQMVMDSVGPRGVANESPASPEVSNFEQTLFRASRYGYAFEQ
jgi:hypothetical protein